MRNITAVFPGTFDPIHFGHIDIATRAAKIFDSVLVAVYDRPLKNLLFSPSERFEMAEKTFQNAENIKVVAYNNLTVEFCRKMNAQVIVRGLRVFSDFENEFRLALANHRLAPDIEVVAFITNEEHTFLSSTTVREIASLGGDISSMVPPHVLDAINRKIESLRQAQHQVVTTTSLRD